MTPPATRVVRRLLLTAAVAGLCAVVAGPVIGLFALAIGLVALATAAAVAMRTAWVAADDGPDRLPAERDAELRRLRAEHLAQVDAALDEGRPDLARALAETHREQVRRLGGSVQPS